MQRVDTNKLSAMGFNLMPLKPESKFPIGEWKHLQHEKYTGEFPDSCNVAVICGEISGNLFVVDLDNPTLFDEFKEYHDRTYTVKTGKGYHLYFRSSGFLPENRKFDDHRFRHIDIKSEGGYVLAAGSIHPDTKKPYEVMYDKPILSINPQAIIDKLKELGFNVQKRSIEEIQKGVGEGSRDDDTFRYACYLIREKGLSGAALEKEIRELNQRHKPPLPERDINRILIQAWRYEGKNITKSEQITSIENLKDRVKSINKKDIILADDFEDYVKILGQETVIDIIKEFIPDANITTVKRKLLRDIDPKLDEGIPIEFEAMIIAVGDRKTFDVEADFACPVGGETKHSVANEYRELMSPYCFTHKCKMVQDRETTKTQYIQELRIQEFLEIARNNSPVEFDAEIIDENVGEAFFNDRKKFVAKLRSVPSRNGKYNDIVFQIIDMEDIDQKEDCMPTLEEIQKWKSTPNMFQRVRDSISPEQYMEHLNEVKETCMLAVVGGTSMNGKRQNINVGLIGDAQLGKSELALFMHKMIPGSGYTVGRQVSGTGLTIGMVKLYNGTMIPQAGLFPKHHGKPVFWDEGDKTKPEDIESVYGVMEQGFVTSTKTGTHGGMKLPASCPVIMCANPKGGKFNSKYPNIMDNFNFDEPFLTRFDILWLIIDENNPELDDRIRKHIREFEQKKSNYMSMEELQRYFSYARSIKAVVPHELDAKVDALHRKMRPLNRSHGVPIGWRQYYGLYRLLTASAALHLRDTVTEEDFDIVENIIRKSLKSLKMDIDTGEVQDVFEKRKQTKERSFLETFNAVMDEDASIDKEEFISKLAEKEPFNALSADQEFQKRLNAGLLIIDNETGRYKLRRGS